MTSLSLTFPYQAMNEVMRLVKAYSASEPVRIISQEFDNTCELSLSLPLDLHEELSARLGAVSGTSVNT